MTTLIMMYVYFDINGNIKSISPDLIPGLEMYTNVTFPLTEVEGFLTGKKNPHDFFVKVVKRQIGTEYKITRKQVVSVSYLRTLDYYLTEVPKLPRSDNALILIENFLIDKKIKISAGHMLKVLRYDPETDEDTELITSLTSSPPSALFFTKRGDPYYHLFTCMFSPAQILETECIEVNYTGDLSNSSVYTKKLLDGYSYVIRKQ